MAAAQAARRCHPSEAFHQGAAPSITDCRVPQHIYRRQQYVYNLLIKSSGSSHRVLDYFNEQMKRRRCTFLPVCVFTELPTKKQQLQALNLLVLLLPQANQDTLKVDARSV